MKETLARLSAGERLSRDEARVMMLGMARNEYNQAQVAAFLAMLAMRGVTPEEVLGLRDGLLETGRPVDLSPYEAVDIVGTGGDGKNTFNISTCACLVVAGAGYKVAKHGNYAATSVSGASDVIEGHGVRFTSDADRLRRSMEECNFAYLHAPLFALGMRNVAPVRKALQIPTCFNLLGPLVNPSRPACQLLGVASLAQMRLYDSVNHRLGIRYCIVSSLDGYDEISLTGPFKVRTADRERVYSPGDLGLGTATPGELRGGATRREAMEIFDGVLSGRGTEGQAGAVVANAAFAIKAMDPGLGLRDCIAKARESLEGGRAMRALVKYVEINS